MLYVNRLCLGYIISCRINFDDIIFFHFLIFYERKYFAIPSDFISNKDSESNTVYLIKIKIKKFWFRKRSLNDKTVYFKWHPSQGCCLRYITCLNFRMFNVKGICPRGKKNWKRYQTWLFQLFFIFVGTECFERKIQMYIY